MKKRKSQEHPISQLTRQRGRSISSEGQSSDIIPPIEDDDEGYDQLLSSSQPFRPSSPLNHMTMVSANDETPTAAKKRKSKSGVTLDGTAADRTEATPTGMKKGKKRKAAADDGAEAVSTDQAAKEHAADAGSTPKAAGEPKKKRKSKVAVGADAEAAERITAAITGGVDGKDKSENKEPAKSKKRKSEAASY